MKKICIFAVLAVLTLGLSGCEEDWYRPGFIGEWDLIEAGGFPVDSRYADAYDFYDNGTGVYYFVDDYGHCVLVLRLRPLLFVSVGYAGYALLLRLRAVSLVSRLKKITKAELLFEGLRFLL